MTAADLTRPVLPFDRAAIEARAKAVTITPQDVQALIFELKCRTTVQEFITAYREAGEEFDGLVTTPAG